MDLNIVFSLSLAQQRYFFIILDPLSAWFKSKNHHSPAKANHGFIFSI